MPNWVRDGGAWLAVLDRNKRAKDGINSKKPLPVRWKIFRYAILAYVLILFGFVIFAMIISI